MYANHYWLDMLSLFWYLPAALYIGLVVRKLALNLNRLFDLTREVAARAMLPHSHTATNSCSDVTSRRRAWRELNLLGFLATFGIAAAWGWMNYRPADYDSTQGFLIAYVLVFVAAMAAELAPSAGAVLVGHSYGGSVITAFESFAKWGGPKGGFDDIAQALVYRSNHVALIERVR